MLCPCGNRNNIYPDCCGRFIEGEGFPATAEILMRSRYTAYTLLREDYLLLTWHSSTRPVTLGLSDEVATKWLGLDVKRHELLQPELAIVEFVARYKVNGRAYRMHEVSRFVFEKERWFYLEGDVD